MAFRSFMRKRKVVLKDTYDGNCTICLNSLCSPITLKCGHMFCDGCLVKYWVALKKRKWFLCPLCRIKISRIEFTTSGMNKLSREFHKQFGGMFRDKPTYEYTKLVLIFIFGVTCAYTASLFMWESDSFSRILQKITS